MKLNLVKLKSTSGAFYTIQPGKGVCQSPHDAIREEEVITKWKNIPN